jgi:hypothetical protein
LEKSAGGLGVKSGSVIGSGDVTEAEHPAKQSAAKAAHTAKD